MRGATVAVLALVVALATSAPALSDDAHPLDATWVGGFDDDGNGVQLIITGDVVVGFYIDGDYADISDSNRLGADGSLTFTWDGGDATLSAKGDDHVLTVREAGKPERVIPVKRDE
jgi:hypothetical protein